MQRQIFRLALIFLTAMAVGACARKYKPEEISPDINAGATYYTQFSLFQEKNVFRTTNYRRGSLIPINTPVILDSIDRKKIETRLAKTGQPFIVANIERHTNEDSQQAFKRIFGRRPVNLARFRKDETSAILEGQVKKGMSKPAVLAAIGYPPKTSTYSTESDDWTYWASRFDRFIVRFKGGRVSEIVN
jgi:hypothetical protein